LEARRRGKWRRGQLITLTKQNLERFLTTLNFEIGQGRLVFIYHYVALLKKHCSSEVYAAFKKYY